MELNYVEYHWCVYLFSSLLEALFAYVFSFHERVNGFYVNHDRPMHWRNDIQKKGLAFAKSYASCIVRTNSPLITRRIWCNNLLLSELRLSSNCSPVTRGFFLSATRWVRIPGLTFWMRWVQLVARDRFLVMVHNIPTWCTTNSSVTRTLACSLNWEHIGWL